MYNFIYLKGLAGSDQKISLRRSHEARSLSPVPVSLEKHIAQEGKYKQLYIHSK